MSTLMDEEIKRWTARRKTALVLENIQGKTTIAEASRSYDLPPSELETWVEDGKKGMENALRANPHLLGIVRKVARSHACEATKTPA